jgi:CheY-like chemotaxis protein/glycine cleavage system H lipoate-binding protein
MEAKMSEKNKRKILVVDDEITVCKSISKAIVTAECEVDMALSGEEALKKDEEKEYDLIITDLMMPGISGMDLLKSLKETREEVIVIMVTGYPTIKTAVQSIKIGAFDYIPKPFTPDQLRSLVSRAFKKKESDEKAEEAPPLKMPAGLYYMIGHTWLRKEENGLVSIGVVSDFFKTVGIITQLELPKVHASVTQGEVCAKITDAEKFNHRIWSPASGRVVMVNEKLREDLSLLRKDSYREGWLFSIEPTNLEEDLKGLILSK